MIIIIRNSLNFMEYHLIKFLVLLVNYSFHFQLTLINHVNLIMYVLNILFNLLPQFQTFKISNLKPISL